MALGRRSVMAYFARLKYIPNETELKFAENPISKLKEIFQIPSQSFIKQKTKQNITSLRIYIVNKEGYSSVLPTQKGRFCQNYKNMKKVH